MNNIIKLVQLDREIDSANYEMKQYKNKKIKLYFAKRKLKKLEKKKRKLEDKINKSYFWKK